MRVKMCGMKTVSAALAAEEAGADYIGFVFAKKSRRFIAPKAAQEIARELRHAQKVGVFVDAPMDEVNAIAALVGLDYVQLHGHETAETARGSERPVIKAYRYGDDFDVDAANSILPRSFSWTAICREQQAARVRCLHGRRRRGRSRASRSLF